MSTHLYHGSRLNRDHLLEIGASGFQVVELFATRTHLDYHSSSVIADLNRGSKNQIVTQKLRNLGMTFGDETLLRQTVAELVTSCRASDRA